jgi:hypothetical protein
LKEDGHTYHEIALYKLQLIRKAFFIRISSGPLNLVVVVVQSRNVSACKLCNLSSRSTNTASDIKDSVSFLDTNFGSQVMFMTSNCLVETFTVCETTEVKRLAPAVFVKICPEIVVAMHVRILRLEGLDNLLSGEGGIFCFSCLGKGLEPLGPRKRV